MGNDTILITGGAGFIGSRLARRLRQAGRAVRVLDNLSPQIHGEVPVGLGWFAADGVELQRGSIVDRAALERALDGVGVVVHLAAETGTGQSMYEIAKYNLVNTQATALLFDVLTNQTQRTVRRVILASSRSIYGEGAYVTEDGDRRLPPARSAAALAAHQWEPVDPKTGRALRAAATHEDDRPSPASIYAATKLAQEDLQRIACTAMGIGFATLRLQNVYGEGQSLNNPYTGILSIFSTRIRRGLDLPLFEDGEETRDFVHVDDVARVLARAVEIETAPDTVINVGSGQATSVKAVAEMLFAGFNVAPKTRVTGEYRLGDIRHNWADIGRLAEALDCRPEVSLPDGIGRFCAWVASQPLPEDNLGRANQELLSRNLMGR